MVEVELLAYWDTPTGELKLLRDKDGELIFLIDDGVQFREGSERRYHEALFTVPACMVKKEMIDVLILGGGDGLGARNLLELPFVKSITLVDISPEVVSLALWDVNMRRLNKDSLHNPKVKVIIGDAYKKVRELSREGKKFDLIVLDYPDVPPVKGHQVERLYSEEHLREVKALLSPQGVVGIQAGSYSSLPIYTEYIIRIIKKVFGRGFTARVVLKGFPDATFYYSSDTLYRPLPKGCFVSTLDKIKVFLYEDERNVIERNIPYVNSPAEAIITDFQRQKKTF